MKKVTKAIKLVSGLTDEEKEEFAEFFKQEVEDEEEVKEEVKKEEPEKPKQKVEPMKEEPKKEEFDFNGFLKQYQEDMKVLVEEVKTLKTQNVEKIGIKAKPKESKGENSFEDIFAKLTK
jgi:hypothetical protein